MITPAHGRKIITINGTADGVIPYLGGMTVRGTFMSAPGKHLPLRPGPWVKRAPNSSMPRAFPALSA